MKIFYDSKTGNIERFIEKLKLELNNRNIKMNIQKINDNTIIDDENSHLITYTTGIGNVPSITKNFLINNFKLNRLQNLKSVSSSGNRNWGQHFGEAGDKISKKFNIKLLYKFELSGTDIDVNNFINLLITE